LARLVLLAAVVVLGAAASRQRLSVARGIHQNPHGAAIGCGVDPELPIGGASEGDGLGIEDPAAAPSQLADPVVVASC
jgi:hypothetical protein